MSRQPDTMTRRSRRGLTLLETAVAMVILGIALVGLIRLYTEGLVTTGRAERRMVAAVLARAKLEEVRHLPQLEDGTETGRVSEPYERYGWRTEIRSLPDYPGVRHVLVTVGWLEGREERTVDIETLVPEPPPLEEGSELAAESGGVGDFLSMPESRGTEVGGA